MHHTDYSANLRAAHHRTLKKASNRAIYSDCKHTESKDLLYAVIAAVLVLLCLVQMDAANAAGTSDSADQVNTMSQSVTSTTQFDPTSFN